jgi:hypothetical protein
VEGGHRLGGWAARGEMDLMSYATNSGIHPLLVISCLPSERKDVGTEESV